MHQPARKPLNTYHHGDLRDALVHAALREAEQGGPEAISIKALAKKLGVSQPAPYRHFADREALLAAVTAEAFRQFSAVLREAIRKPSKRSKLSRLAQATLTFGLRRNGIYRLMFTSRIMACTSSGSELHTAAMETFALVLEALEAPAPARNWWRISCSRPKWRCRSRLRRRPHPDVLIRTCRLYRLLSVVSSKDLTVKWCSRA